MYFQRVHERYISEDHTIREKDDTPVQVNYLKADYIGIHGGTATGGHYWGYIREGDRWYEVNDSCVFEANVSEIVARAKDIVCVFPHSAVLQAPEAELLESVKLRYIADQADIAAQNVAVDAQEQATAIQIQKLSRGILTRARLQRAKAAANAGEAKRRGGQGEDSESESEKEDAV